MHIAGDLGHSNLVNLRFRPFFYYYKAFVITACVIVMFYLIDYVDVGRFAYKSIRIHRGRSADTTLVDSHTSKSFRLQFESPTLKSIRIQKSHSPTYLSSTLFCI